MPAIDRSGNGLPAAAAAPAPLPLPGTSPPLAAAPTLDLPAAAPAAASPSAGNSGSCGRSHRNARTSATDYAIQTSGHPPPRQTQHRSRSRHRSHHYHHHLVRGICMHNLDPKSGANCGFFYVYILLGAGSAKPPVMATQTSSFHPK